MKYNSLMHNKLKYVDINDVTLPKELEEYVNAGFSSIDGCVFLTCFMKSIPSDNYVFDKTGVECFVNSIHIDDYVSDKHLEHSLLFCEEVFKKWEDEVLTGELKSIISLDDFGAVVKFHMARAGEHWLNENLEKYDDAILYIDDIGDLNVLRVGNVDSK